MKVDGKKVNDGLIKILNNNNIRILTASESANIKIVEQYDDFGADEPASNISYLDDKEQKKFKNEIHSMVKELL